jgi:hypothetical protein
MFESKAFVCPYFQCRKTFRKPLMLTDNSKVPRETYYACPHCLSRVDIATDNKEKSYISTVEVSESKELAGPIECPYHFGYLRSLPKENSIPDKCLTCANLMQCTA